MDTLLPEFAKALVKFRSELKPAVKDANNPFFKSTYADLSSIIEASREPLAANGLSFVQVVHDGEAAKVETLIVHESGQWMSCGTVSIMPAKRDPQGFGSAIKYARRYSLESALGIPTEDDDGNEASRPSSKPKALPVTAPAPTQSTEPMDYYWYDFKGLVMDKDKLEYLKRRECVKDASNGLWFAPQPLGGDKEGYRTDPPQN